MSNKKERIHIDWVADDVNSNPVYEVTFYSNGREVEGQVRLSDNRSHMVLNGSFWDKRYPEVAFDDFHIERKRPKLHRLTIEEVSMALKMISQ